MTPTPTVERVARAIAKSFGDDPDGFTGSLLNENERWWQHYVEHAIAAIEALREPSDEMVNAANALDEVSKGVLITPIPERAWEAMIDAALGRGGV